ncbi:hypothetical protein ACJU26_11060 [Acidithiobacillus sp. M4-SHS-6]|uniref:hypothetical protein n=1 Tax=Acidithiobacillus sp. M4-SHS-6 TaxID=3383024 RepID=UPI0039BDCB29
MKALSLPRTLANALLSDLQSGRGEGLVGALHERPCSVYPAQGSERAAALELLTSRGESLFACYAAAPRNPTPTPPETPQPPFDPPYQIRLATDIRGVIVLRAYTRDGGQSWQENIIVLEND